MPVIYLVYPFLITSGLLFSLLLLILMQKYRKHQLSRAILGIGLTAFGVNVSTLLSMYAPNATMAGWWHGPIRLSVYGFIALAGLIFVSGFIQSRNSSFRNRFPWYALFIVPLLTVLISLTNNWHHWFILSYTMDWVGSYFIRTGWEPGPWFWVHAVYSYLISIGLLWVLAVWISRTKQLLRWRGLLILSVVVLFVGAVSLDTFGFQLSPGLLIAPVSFGATSFLLLLGVWYLDLLDILPMAREALINYLPDPVLIVDEYNRTLDINSAGEALLGRSLQEVRGQDILQFITPENQPNAQAAMSADEYHGTTQARVSGEQRSFDVRVSRIFLEKEVIGGKVIIMRDITELTKLQEQNIQRIAFEERQHIARDLHDAVSQTLFSARLTSDMLLKQKETIQPDFLWKSIAHISNLVKSALGEMRILLLELRPEGLQNAEIATLLTHLADAASSQTEAKIHLEKQIQSQLPVNINIAFYRIAQEAINNIIKHSNASNISIKIICQNDLAELTVEDDGKGFDLDKISGSQLGLKIMCERADEAGVQLDIQTQLQQGTRITCFWKA